MKKGDEMEQDIVRRLTPLECERLQGYPDNWTLLGAKEEMNEAETNFWNKVRLKLWQMEPEETEKMVKGVKKIIKKKPFKPFKNSETALKWYNQMISSDTPRYKALGNSIALPQWWWLMCRLEPYLPEKPTLGSLFDGIGGFPLVFEEKYEKGSARWASEIEAFPIAVTMVHFPEGE